MVESSPGRFRGNAVVIDGDQDVAEMLSAAWVVYDELPNRLVRVESYDKGREQLEAHPETSLIILPINHNNPVAIGFIEELKQNQATSKIPIIVLDTSHNVKQEEDLLKHGVKKVIPVPMDMDMFAQEATAIIMNTKERNHD